MAITLGTFTKLDDGIFSGTLKTLNVSAALTVVPVDKVSDNAPDYRVYAGPRHEVGAGWSQVAKSSGETYINLKIGSPAYAVHRISPNSARTGSAAGWLSSTARPKTGPPTLPCGSRATANRKAPPRLPRRGFRTSVKSGRIDLRQRRSVGHPACPGRGGRELPASGGSPGPLRASSHRDR